GARSTDRHRVHGRVGFRFAARSPERGDRTGRVAEGETRHALILATPDRTARQGRRDSSAVDDYRIRVDWDMILRCFAHGVCNATLELPRCPAIPPLPGVWRRFGPVFRRARASVGFQESHFLHSLARRALDAATGAGAVAALLGQLP